MKAIEGRFDQSELKTVKTYDETKAYNGYTLFNPIGKKEACLIDMAGRVVHQWRMERKIRIAAELLPNGNILCGGMTEDAKPQEISGSSGELIEVDWDGNIVWRFEDPYLNSHDWARMDNGNTIIGRYVPIPEELASKIEGGIPGTELDGIMWGNVLQEIDPNGKVVWEWIAHEHMDVDEDKVCTLCPRDSWSYINAIEALPDGDVMISLRAIDTIAIIDRKTGRFRWKWGRGELAHQHNPTLLDNGRILLFDNGLHRRNPVCLSYSRLLEVNPKTEKIEWEYQDENTTKFYSCVCSGVQRLPNGNTLVCEATKGRIFEITPEKETVWEYISPHFGYFHRHNIGWTNMVYRAYRYGIDYPGLRKDRMDPDRYEWVFHEKGKEAIQSVEETEAEDRVKDRLKRLGY